MTKCIRFVVALLLVLINLESKAQCTATTVPYFEGFSALTNNNQLPNCWAASNPSVTCLTFTNMGAVAAFSFSPGGTSHFFTGPLQLHAGVNYSLTFFYKVSTGAPGNWTNLSASLGPNQGTLGLVSIASTSGILTNTNYIALTATFSVPNTQVYYGAISATGQPTANAQFLYWDDLEITMPCSINPVNINATSSHSVLCAGDCATLSATGANTYYWSNGAIGQTVVICPSPSLIKPNMPGLAQSTSSFLVVYEVVGSNTLTNCTATTSVYIPVNPKPQVQAIANPTLMCLGEASNLQSFGAATYTWSGGQTGNIFVVTPTLNTGYSVIGENSFGCKDTAYVTLNVDACVGLSSNGELKRVMVFPNPFSTFLKFEFEVETCWSARLITIDGKALAEFEGSGLSLQINTESLSKGVYYLRICKNQEMRYYKLIKN